MLLLLLMERVFSVLGVCLLLCVVVRVRIVPVWLWLLFVCGWLCCGWCLCVSVFARANVCLCLLL